jgi:hypothetical protein
MGNDGMRWYQLFLNGTTFNMPLLYVYGKLDSVIIPEYLIGIENYFPSTQIVQIDAAHFVQEEKPAEVAQALNAFFTRPVINDHIGEKAVLLARNPSRIAFWAIRDFFIPWRR